MAIRWEIFITWAALACTAIASVLFLSEAIGLAEVELFNAHHGALLEIGVYLILVGFLTYGNFGYQLARLGYLKRLFRHHPAVISELRKFAQSALGVTILIPSYKEETAVIRQTLLSAALQQYPNKRVVLLLDDPPQARTDQDRSLLCAARRLPAELQCMFEGSAAYFSNALLQFKRRQNNQSGDVLNELTYLAAAYKKAVHYYDMIAKTCHDNTHSDDWFKEKILEEPQRALQQRADELLHFVKTLTDPEGASISDMAAEYEYLAGIFRVEFLVFERKRYCNLSSEPNKAMNLNSYLGIMGKHLKEVHRPEGCHLVESLPSESTMFVPNTPYVITLDADSLLLPDYALKLIHHIEQPGNERLAVVQTPYSAIPHAPNALERTAGATTDIQYCIHQGFTYFSATFWVGANALLRKAALDDIAILREHGTRKIPCYIQDATVIEDTESTVDLISKGWRLFNYPAQMAYSATPSDFGSLLIQRSRWANGGLLIVPKLLKYLWKAPKNFRTLNEAFYRFHYLTSLAGAPLSVLLLMTVPFSATLTSIWLPLTALPYFMLYGRDLSLMGYDGCRDLFRVYALNLLLIPIHLSGACKSLRQKLTGQKSPFQRIPKVSGRTRAPRIYIGLEYALILFLLAFATMDVISGRWFASVFATLNAGLLLYAIHLFIGFPESIDDFTYRVARQTHRFGALIHSESTFIGGSPTEVAVANVSALQSRNE